MTPRIFCRVGRYTPIMVPRLAWSDGERGGGEGRRGGGGEGGGRSKEGRGEEWERKGISRTFKKMRGLNLLSSFSSLNVWSSC